MIPTPKVQFLGPTRPGMVECADCGRLYLIAHVHKQTRFHKHAVAARKRAARASS